MLDVLLLITGKSPPFPQLQVWEELLLACFHPGSLRGMSGRSLPCLDLGPRRGGLGGEPRQSWVRLPSGSPTTTGAHPVGCRRPSAHPSVASDEWAKLLGIWRRNCKLSPLNPAPPSLLPASPSLPQRCAALPPPPSLNLQRDWK